MTMSGRRLLALLLISMTVYGGAVAASAQALDLILPTRNDALLRGDGPGFYQYTDRYFEGRRSRPWEGGQYGFVRNQKRTPHGIVNTRFHEGADIQPVFRDGRGEPRDTVRAIDDGEVVYANTIERHSNYGKYVVVEHWWNGAPYYSLYAHLNSIEVQAGQRVAQGNALGRLGYTGRGINRRRAHLHFEINLLLNRAFQMWYDGQYSTPNYHGLYNGINMAGLDVPQLYLALHNDTSLTITDFLARQKAFFAVTIPGTGEMLDLLWRYPWLSPSLNPWTFLHHDAMMPKSWTISFAQSGLPLRIEPSYAAVEEPQVMVFEPSPISYAYLTEGLIEGNDQQVTLGSRGERYLALLTTPFEFRQRRTEW